MLNWNCRACTRFTSTISLALIRSFSSTSSKFARRIPGRGEQRSKRPWELENLEEFKFDDQTAIGHDLYDNIREVRTYLRKAKFELPQLKEFVKPFIPPTQKHILCFKFHTYLGESHPTSKKVVLSVKVANLGLTSEQRHKFLLLCGPRYNPEKEEIVFSSEKFPYRAQNKKYLSDLLEKVLVEAKDPVETFADIPLDTRHVKPKIKYEFPKEWLPTFKSRTDTNIPTF